MECEQQEVVKQAIVLAEKWQNRANVLLTRQERRLQEQLRRLLAHPSDKVLLSQLIDQSFRSNNNRRSADQLRALLNEYGPPQFLDRVEQGLLRLLATMDSRLAAPFMPILIAQMRRLSSRLIIPGEAEPLHHHLQERRSQGVRVNINHLGEAVLGEQEAAHRLTTYINDLKDPDIEHISIKISTLYSQINPLAFDATVTLLKERLSILYRVAQQHLFMRPDGVSVPKFINLDGLVKSIFA